jgi:hypothetical protein
MLCARLGKRNGQTKKARRQVSQIRLTEQPRDKAPPHEPSQSVSPRPTDERRHDETEAEGERQIEPVLEAHD